MNKEIQRLKELLEARKEEYEVFGMTGEDASQDAKTIQEIQRLEMLPDIYN